MMQEGLVTVERAKVLVYRPGKADKA
jgi:hypothetical protein